jgi:hypothetical protein
MKNVVKIVAIFFLALAGHGLFAQDTLVPKTIIKYQINLNANYNKNIVDNLIIVSNNSFLIQTPNIKIEPTLNYKYGYVIPDGRPTINLENDIFFTLENGLWHQKKVFPTVLLGYENSPNFRTLQHRLMAGAGFGIKAFKKRTNFLNVNHYLTYEDSDYKTEDKDLLRFVVSMKGGFILNKGKMGMNYSIFQAQSLTSFSDIRIRGMVRPYIKLSEHLSANFLYELWNEKSISTAYPGTISSFSFGLSLDNF